MIGPDHFRHRNKIGRFTAVEQSEVAQIVGMTEVDHAQWLAEGNMPWRTEQTDPISTVEVIRLMLAYQLYLAGCSPRQTMLVVGKAIAPVFYKAFTSVDHSLEVTGLPKDVERFRESFISSSDLADDLSGGPHYISHIYRDGEHQEFRAVGDIRDLIEQGGVQPPNYVCLREMACGVTSRLGRPLLSVELENEAPPEESSAYWLSTTREAKFHTLE